jgi:hypothetical protein
MTLPRLLSLSKTDSFLFLFWVDGSKQNGGAAAWTNDMAGLIYTGRDGTGPRADRNEMLQQQQLHRRGASITGL